MSPAEQRSHTTKTDQLDFRIRALEELAQAQLEYMGKWAPALVGQLEDAQRAILGLEAAALAARAAVEADRLAQTARVDALEARAHQLETQQRIRDADNRLQALEWFRNGLTLWERLRWLLRGVR